MDPRLRVRIVRIASEIRYLRHYRSLVHAMGDISDAMNASASDMKAAMEGRDVDRLSRAIMNVNKVAKELEFVVQGHTRIIQNMEPSNET